MVSPTNPYLHELTCPQGHPWQEKPFNQHDNIYMFLGALRQLYRVTRAVQGRSIGD